MFGYIAVFLGVVLLVVLIPLLLKAGASSKGRVGKTNSVEQPAADEPTPARSVTATPAQKQEAEKHVPPA